MVFSDWILMQYLVPSGKPMSVIFFPFCMQFGYARPDSVQEACNLLDENTTETTLLAGGQSLLPLLRDGSAAYEYVIDINQLPDREYIRLEDGRIRIGCLTRHAQVVESEVVRENCGVLAGAVSQIGDSQVRNRGTVCGALAHAGPSGDPPLVAVLLDAEILARDADGETVYPARSFYHGASSTALDPNEIITEARFPVVGSNRGVSYNKWHPTEVSYAVASVGASVTLVEGQVTDASIVTGAVEPTPRRWPPLAELLVGTEPTEATINEVATAVGEACDPVTDFEGSPEFKREMITTLTKRSLTDAIENAREP